MKLDWERPGIVRLTGDLDDLDQLLTACLTRVSTSGVPAGGGAAGGVPAGGGAAGGVPAGGGAAGGMPAGGADVRGGVAGASIGEADGAVPTSGGDDLQRLAARLGQLRQALAAASTPARPVDPSEPLPGLFHPGARELQDRFDTRRIADRIDERLVHNVIGDSDREFIERADMFFLATADEWGRPNCSYKGGDPGFVRVLDERTLAFPNYDGNGMFLSTGNIIRNPAVGMLFIDFERGHRTRVNGDATLDSTPELVAAWPEAQFVVRVRVREVFPNCPRYIHRYQLLRRSSFVPHAEASTPVPSWKRSGWAVDALPVGDPARDPAREVLDR